MKTRIAAVESQTFNGSVEWGIPGQYFKLLTAAAACGVELFSGGQRILNAPAARRGFYQGVDEGFDRIRITNSGSQLIEFLIAGQEGGSDAFSGSLDITSPLVADNADGQAAAGANGALLTLARLEALNAGGTYDRLRLEQLISRYALRTSDQGFAYGASFNSTTALVAGTSQAVFSAAANVNGAIVWAANIFGRNTAAEFTARLGAHTVAPNNITSGDTLFSASSSAPGAANVLNGTLARGIVVPAGKGAYFDTTSSVAQSYLNALYTLL